MRHRPTLLAILDGFGESPASENNAVKLARTPNIDRFRAEYPSGVLDASETHVGLPSGQVGNSEVGHMSMGSGRVLPQELPRINKAVAEGTLGDNAQIAAHIQALKTSGGTCHLMGLLSPGGVHSHLTHMASLANLVQKSGVPVRVHAFLDGRDTPPQSALDYLEQFRALAPEAVIATVGGRYFAMDRDSRYEERVQPAYRAMAEGVGPRAATPEDAVKASYANGKTDEFVPHTIIGDYAGMQSGDGILMANFRADRVQQILKAFVKPDFAHFARERKLHFASLLGLTPYSDELDPYVNAAFKPEKLKGTLAQTISDAGWTQLHIAETEKYPHVTYFFNGGREAPFEGESRILIPSPKVATYDLQPEMSAPEVTDRLVEAINGKAFDFIVVNYANTDMVGHTGNLAATIRAVEAVDEQLGRVAAAIEKMGGAMLITADHGNAEMMHDAATHQPHTAHTLNQVPVILMAPELKHQKMELPHGRLADVAPTLLKFLGLEQPAEMTGTPLLWTERISKAIAPIRPIML